MLRKLRMWYISTFVVLKYDKAVKMGLSWLKNVYGDEINHTKCRSKWIDDDLIIYRVDELYREEPSSDFKEAVVEYHKHNQVIEDIKISIRIEESAIGALRDYNQQKERCKGKYMFVPMLVIRPFVPYYTIHDWATAKYKDVSINKLAEDRFNELLKEQESKEPYKR